MALVGLRRINHGSNIYYLHMSGYSKRYMCLDGSREAEQYRHSCRALAGMALLKLDPVKTNTETEALIALSATIFAPFLRILFLRTSRSILL